MDSQDEDDSKDDEKEDEHPSDTEAVTDLFESMNIAPSPQAPSTEAPSVAAQAEPPVERSAAQEEEEKAEHGVEHEPHPRHSEMPD